MQKPWDPQFEDKDVNAGGTVVSLHLCPGHRKPMLEVSDVEASENLGFKGDRHALADSSRQILLIEKETLDMLSIRPGSVKENVTTSGIVLMELARGERLGIGDEVVLEITKPCSPCNRMEEIRLGLLQELTGRRGMLARVVTGGTIRRGDRIRVMEKGKT